MPHIFQRVAQLVCELVFTVLKPTVEEPPREFELLCVVEMAEVGGPDFLAFDNAKEPTLGRVVIEDLWWALARGVLAGSAHSYSILRRGGWV